MMTEPLFLSDEWWGSCGPDWDSLVAYKAFVESYGLTVREWRMHPRPYTNMMAALVPKFPDFNLSDPHSAHRAVLGAPLIIDSTLEESRARVCVHVEAITIGGEGRGE